MDLMEFFSKSDGVLNEFRMKSTFKSWFLWKIRLYNFQMMTEFTNARFFLSYYLKI